MTGPIITPHPVRFHGHVATAVALYKDVSRPRAGAAAHVSNNVAVCNWRVVPIPALVAAGIDPFQGIPERARNTILPLPAPTGYRRPNR